MRARQIIFADREKIRVDDVDVPPPGEGEVTVEAAWSMISPGTELAFLRAMPGTSGVFPQFTGYSSAGRVVEVGKGVDALKPGDRVVAQMLHQSCATVPAKLCTPAPEGVDLRTAAIFRIGTISLGGVRKGQVQLGHSVLVVGLGLVGNLACQFAQAAGATCVVGVDPVSWRRVLANDCGIAHTAEACDKLDHLPLPQHVRERGFDTVIEATGVPAVFNDAVRPVKRRGLMVLLGSSRGITEQVNFYKDVHQKGVTLIGAHDSVRPAEEDMAFWFTLKSDTRTVLELMQAGRLHAAPLISDEVAADDAPSAYARLLDRDEQLMTIAIRWGHSEPGGVTRM